MNESFYLFNLNYQSGNQFDYESTNTSGDIEENLLDEVFANYGDLIYEDENNEEIPGLNYILFHFLATRRFASWGGSETLRLVLIIVAWLCLA